jgi:DNA helicase TIP49 (TBP-interacting protein)
MAAVRLLLERAASGAGGVLVLHGPPGAGKTALADAAAAEGRQRGFDVARVAASPAGMVWAQLVRGLGVLPETVRRLVELQGWRRWIWKSPPRPWCQRCRG